ncbi:MAG: hypothetical protein FJ320_12465 [SAR202 cluster bacterium]|nr:hypothetical protein [SAR202 cluster bacterium]
MEKIDTSTVASALNHLGLKEDPRTIKQLLPLFQQYQKRLQPLYDAPVNHLEVAARFNPAWDDDT